MFDDGTPAQAAGFGATRVEALCVVAEGVADLIEFHRGKDRKCIVMALTSRPQRLLEPDAVVRVAAAVAGVPIHRIFSTRWPRVVRARFVAALVMRTYMKASHPAIARALHWRDHTNSIHACRRAEQERARDDDFDALVVMTINRLRDEGFSL